MLKLKKIFFLSKITFLPLKFAFRSLFFNIFFYFAFCFLGISFLIADIFIVVTLKNTTNTITIQYMYITINVIYSILTIVLFSYLSLKLFMHNVKDNVHKVEMRYGYSVANIYFSRIIVLLIIFSIIIFWQAILAIIFYFVSSSSIHFFSYKLLMIPIGWVAIFSIMTIFISLLFSLLMGERIGSILGPMFLIIILALSMLSPFISGVKISKSFNNGAIVMSFDKNQYLATGLKYTYEYQIYDSLNNNKDADTFTNEMKTAISNKEDKTITINNFVTNEQQYPILLQINKLSQALADYSVDIKQLNDDSFVSYILFPKLATIFDNSNNKTFLFLKYYLTNYKVIIPVFNADENSGDFLSYNAEYFPTNTEKDKWSKFINYIFVSLCYSSIYDFNVIHSFNDDRFLVYSEKNVYTIMNNKIKYLNLFSPLSQIDNMFFGVNYLDSKLGYINDSSAALICTIPNINFNLNYNLYKNSYNQPDSFSLENANLQINVPVEIIYVVYFLVMFGVICIMEIRFRKIIKLS